MDSDELSAQFFEGLFSTDEERLIVRRLLQDVNEHLLVDQLLSAEGKEETQS